MEPAIDPNIIDTLPRPLTRVQHALVKAREQTGHIPYKYQLDVALALESSRDVLCVAGTGCGKSLAFILILFMYPEWIVWIISPLNFIENQMAKDYNDMGFRATSVNASTLTPKLLDDIKSGTYSVIISSPEAFHDHNKLRLVLFSKELSNRRHITIADEAHCIRTWGESGFRKVYERVGDMRVFIPDPEHSPICAATATCSGSVKHTITRCLHLKDDYDFINLGNWRSNLCYGLHVMEGGQRSYAEITKLFDATAEPFEKRSQAVIFVETYLPGYWIAYELRKHFGLSGSKALEGIAVYHSLLGEDTKRYIELNFRYGKIKILVSSEALTMGANFPDICLVLTYLATQTLEAWVQRAGRGARSSDIQCLCIMIVTKSIVQNAIKACKEANIPVDPTLAALKAEAPEDEEVDILARPVDEDTSTDDTPTPSRPSKGTKNGRRTMDLGVSEYIATVDCRTAVLDREFNNPPHKPCYEVGGCDRCVERRERDEEADRHIEERRILKEEAQDRNIEDFEPEEARERKKPSKRDDEHFRYGELKKRFSEALTNWRWDKFLELSELYDLTPDWIMTDKELAAIAKTKGVLDATSFDQPAIQWPGRPEWRVEVLEVLARVQRGEDERLAELDRQQKEKEAERERIQMEREAERERIQRERGIRLEQERLEKAAQEQQRAEERAREQEERDRKAVERRARVEQRAARSAASTKQMEAASGGLFTTFSLTPTHAAQSTPTRAVGTMRIHPNGLPSPVTPSQPVLSTLQNVSTTTLHGYEPLPTPSASMPSASTSAQPPNPPGPSTPSRPPRRRKHQPGFVFVPYEGPK